MMRPIQFLDSVAGYVRNGSESSADNPIKLAVVDPDFDPNENGIEVAPTGARVTFEGEETVSGKKYPIAHGVILAPSMRVWMVPIGRPVHRQYCGDFGAPVRRQPRRCEQREDAAKRGDHGREQ
jgi:hypothetical protein